MKVKDAHVWADCPYCGNRNDLGQIDITPKKRTRGTIVVCDIEQGGCDKTFAIKLNVTITVSRYKLEGRYGTESEADK